MRKKIKNKNRTGAEKDQKKKKKKYTKNLQQPVV